MPQATTERELAVKAIQDWKTNPIIRQEYGQIKRLVGKQ